jgi:hypothetical protein
MIKHNKGKQQGILNSNININTGFMMSLKDKNLELQKNATG